jgi:hypothetical protein
MDFHEVLPLVAKDLKENTSLHSSTISHGHCKKRMDSFPCTVCCSTSKKFAEVLQKNTTLERVALSHNEPYFFLLRNLNADRPDCPHGSRNIDNMNKMLELNHLGQKDMIRDGSRLTKQEFSDAILKAPENLRPFNLE